MRVLLAISSEVESQKVIKLVLPAMVEVSGARRVVLVLRTKYWCVCACLFVIVRCVWSPRPPDTSHGMANTRGRARLLLRVAAEASHGTISSSFAAFVVDAHLARS